MRQPPHPRQCASRGGEFASSGRTVRRIPHRRDETFFYFGSDVSTLLRVFGRFGFVALNPEERWKRSIGCVARVKSLPRRGSHRALVLSACAIVRLLISASRYESATFRARIRGFFLPPRDWGPTMKLESRRR